MAVQHSNSSGRRWRLARWLTGAIVAIGLGAVSAAVISWLAWQVFLKDMAIANAKPHSGDLGSNSPVAKAIPRIKQSQKQAGGELPVHPKGQAGGRFQAQ